MLKKFHFLVSIGLQEVIRSGPDGYKRYYFRGGGGTIGQKWPKKGLFLDVFFSFKKIGE